MTTLKFGDKGRAVTDFQDALRVALGGAPVAVDGIYGTQTEGFVQKAYEAFKLPSTPRFVSDALFAAVTHNSTNVYEAPVKNTPAKGKFFDDYAKSPEALALAEQKKKDEGTSPVVKAGIALAIAGIAYVALKGAKII